MITIVDCPVQGQDINCPVQNMIKKGKILIESKILQNCDLTNTVKRLYYEVREFIESKK